MSTAVHRSPNKVWRSNSIFNLWGTCLTNCEAGEVVVSTAPETLTTKADFTLMIEWTSERRRGCDLVYEDSLRITLISKKTRVVVG